MQNEIYWCILIEQKMDETKKSYEISFCLKSADAVGEIDRVLDAIGASVLERTSIKEIRLAYPIKKQGIRHANAYFGFYHFRADSSAILSLRHDLDLNDKILRFLIITPPISKKEPVLQGFQDRAPASKPPIPSQVQLPQVLTNEALEQKLEEILK